MISYISCREVILIQIIHYLVEVSFDVVLQTVEQQCPYRYYDCNGGALMLEMSVDFQSFQPALLVILL